MKICVMGHAGVGKTSLVHRFMQRDFTTRFLSTIGVEISHRPFLHAHGMVDLVVWDLAGTKHFDQLTFSYLRGAAGYILVIDGTQPETWEAALQLQNGADMTMHRGRPFVVALNKCDLTEHWNPPRAEIDRLRHLGWQFVETSARDGTGIDTAFAVLVDQIVGSHLQAFSS